MECIHEYINLILFVSWINSHICIRADNGACSSDCFIPSPLLKGGMMKFASSEIFALAGVICIGFGSLWCVACLVASITCYALGWGEA